MVAGRDGFPFSRRLTNNTTNSRAFGIAGFSGISMVPQILGYGFSLLISVAHHPFLWGFQMLPAQSAGPLLRMNTKKQTADTARHDPTRPPKQQVRNLTRRCQKADFKIVHLHFFQGSGLRFRSNIFGAKMQFHEI